MLATGASPWNWIIQEHSPVGAAQRDVNFVPPLRGYREMEFQNHGLTPVARVVSPLRGSRNTIPAPTYFGARVSLPDIARIAFPPL